MNTKRVKLLVIVMVFLTGVISVDAASLNSTAAQQPWTVQRIDGNVPDVWNLSTAFVGKNQVPMLSYTKTGSNRIYQVHLATEEVPGNCGPDQTWYCNYWQDLDLLEGTVSNLATFLYGPDTFGVKWAYGTTDGTLRGATVEYLNDMTYVTQSWEDLIDLGKFGGILVGPPSLQVVGGWYRAAVTIRSGGGFPTYKLVYMYKTGIQNSSCVQSGTSLYQCDVIEEAIGYDSIGTPSLQVGSDQTVGIAYYKNGAIKYAYPWTEGVIFRPVNCGPGDPKTYRCISISEISTVGQKVALAIGKDSSERGLVFAFSTTLFDGLKHANYVGSGGNCGLDGLLGFDPIYRWQCDDIAGSGQVSDIFDLTFSIDIDPEGFSVVAYEFDDKLSIIYPKARLGDSTSGWTSQVIDGNDFSETGNLPSISINNDGLGFIGYMQPTYCSGPVCIPDNSPNLKVALQRFNTYLPLTLHE